MIRSLRALPLVACAACGSPPGDSAPDFFDGEAAITAVDWGCSTDDDQWAFVVETEGWTAQALLSMSDDGERYESHTMLSAEAAADGRWDRLEMSLDIVADPRDAEPASSSAYLCDANTLDALAFRLVVYDAFSEQVTDCRVWGQELDWNGVAGYSPCDKRLED